jgi:excisionase family DNA binding protein
MRYHAWITQMRTLDVLIDAESRDDAERVIRGQLRSTPSDSWIDAATVIKLADSTPQPPQASLPTPPRQVWSIPDAAERLGVSRTTLYALIKNGELGSVTIGRRRFVAEEQLQRYLDDQIHDRPTP